MNENRREYNRVKISFPVECLIPSKRSYFYTVCKDLSLSGVKILSQGLIPKGDQIKVNINLINQIVPLNAKVIWSSKERSADRYLSGLSFIDTSKEKEGVLSRFLNRLH